MIWTLVHGQGQDPHHQVKGEITDTRVNERVRVRVRQQEEVVVFSFNVETGWHILLTPWDMCGKEALSGQLDAGMAGGGDTHVGSLRQSPVSNLLEWQNLHWNLVGVSQACWHGVPLRLSSGDLGLRKGQKAWSRPEGLMMGYVQKLTGWLSSPKDQ